MKLTVKWRPNIYSSYPYLCRHIEATFDFTKLPGTDEQSFLISSNIVRRWRNISTSLGYCRSA
jgi:hypothetical protein